MNALKLIQKQIIFNSIEQISQLEPFNKYKYGNIVKCKTGLNYEYVIYLIPSVTRMEMYTCLL